MPQLTSSLVGMEAPFRVLEGLEEEKLELEASRIKPQYCY